ncbi:hypothetical protein KSS87_008027 [Heliosperma pusillum]|nr:hypothetical protein KSS87_008027 [Heliosperma pusillum]
MKCLGIPIPLLLRCHDPSLEISTTRGYTLIPRPMISNIRVFAIQLDMHMNVSQSQYPNVFYHVGTTINHTTNNNNNNNNNMSDIHSVTYNGDVTWVRDMISRKRELIWCKDAQGNIPLHLALEKGDKQVASYLIREFPQGSYALNQVQESPLYLGVVNGHKDLVESMLKNLARDIKEATKSLRKGKSILFPAITANSQVTVALGIGVRVVPSKQAQNAALGRARKWGTRKVGFGRAGGRARLWADRGRVGPEMVQVILETFPDLVSKDLSYPIHKACLQGHIHILEIFRTHCPKYFTKPDQDGLTILHHAAKEPNNKLKDVVSYLLNLEEGKTLVNKKDQTKRTPFELALGSENGEVVAIFIQNRRS